MASTTPPTSIDTKENMEAKVLAMLASTYPNLDCGPGTPMYEMVVRPIAFLWARQAQGIEELTSALDITNYYNLTNDDMDRLVSRYFIKRNEGSYVTGIVRIMFINREDVYIAAGDVYEASNDRLYEVITGNHIAASDLSGDSINGYYVDISVKSIGRGNMYNASAGDSLTITGAAGKLYSRAYFVADTSDGGIIESNYNLYSRAIDQTANRGLYSYRSVVAAMRDNFSNISECTPIGIRDDEMTRDLVDILGYGMCHRGGMCDIYIKPSSFRIVEGYKSPLGFPISFTDTDGIEYSMMKNANELKRAWNLALSKGVKVKALDENDNYLGLGYRGSSKEQIAGLSESSGQMKTLTIDPNELQDFDNFVNSSSETLLHTDNLVKQKWPIVVCVYVEVEDAMGEDIKSDAKTTIANYINGLSTSQAPTNTEVIHILRDAGVDVVHLPIVINAYYLTEDLTMQRIGLNLESDPVDSLLVPVEDDSLKFKIVDRSQISLNTCCWYTNEDLINIEVRP